MIRGEQWSDGGRGKGKKEGQKERNLNSCIGFMT